MVLHRAVRKRLFAHEEIAHEAIAHEDAAPVFREGRAIDRLVRAKVRRQRALLHKATEGQMSPCIWTWSRLAY